MSESFPLKDYDADTDALIDRLFALGTPSRIAWTELEDRYRRTPSPEAHRVRADAQARGSAAEFDAAWQWLSGVTVRQHVRACWKAAKALARGKKAVADKYRAEAEAAAARICKFRDRIAAGEVLLDG